MEVIKSSGQLEKKLKEFNQDQLDEILENTLAIQLTQGCSTGCTDCGLGAKRGVTDYIPFKILIKLFSNKKLGNNKETEVSLYFASDPFDYDFDGKSYLDVHKLYEAKVGENPGVITSIPRGKEELIFNILAEDSHFFEHEDRINAISLTEFNYPRIKKVFENLAYVKNQKEFYDKPYSIRFPAGAIFDSLKKVDFKEFLRQLNLGSLEVRDFYHGEIDRYRLGKKNRKNLGEDLISLYRGTILTPKGIYNVKPTKPKFSNPIGQIITPITPKKFFVERFAGR